MSLVDYASSDEGSGNESDTEEKKVIETKENSPKSSADTNKVSDNVSDDSVGELFTSLPKPRKTFSFLDDDNNKLSKLLLNKNSLASVGKNSVKISVPSVSEFDDVSNGPAPKKLKPSVKGTGLFSILPPPKNTSVKQTNRSLVPQVVSKNQVKKTVNQSQFSKVASTSVKGTEIDEDDEDDTIVGTSFFGSSLVEQNSKSDLEHSSNENTLLKETSNSYATPGSSFINEAPIAVQNPITNIVVDESNSYSASPPQAQETFTASDNPLDLDEKALQILCGNKKKRHNMPMNVIDLSGKEILPDSKEWLLKQFTEERGRGGRGLSHRKTGGPSSQSRRKHQITYLAYQAKEQELELKNQWAQNRMSRKQTQSKYGF